LVRLLGLPRAAVGTGYEYIAQGELPEGMVEADLRAVGAAPAPAGGGVTDPAVEEVKQRLRALVRPSPALARIIGAEPLPYGDVLGKVHQYLVRHGLFDTSATMPVAVADDALRPVFGADRLPYPQLPFVLQRHLTPV
jgi:hypothetical protein